MKERPILFSAPMVKAILAGKKTQTRRIFFCDNAGPNGAGEIVYGRRGGGWAAWEGDVDADGWPLGARLGETDLHRLPCPYGKPGDRLWVRETFALETLDGTDERVVWAADRAAAWRVEGVFEKVFYLESAYAPERWRPSIHMPRWASRIDLEITDVRCERLHDISEKDILAEGVTVDRAAEWTGIPWSNFPTLHHAWAALWDHINGDRAPWASDPWVWVLGFKLVRP